MGVYKSNNRFNGSNRIYFDCAATTPVASEVLKAMGPYFGPPIGGKYGNPGSLHSFGQEAMAAVDKSRETIAKAIGAPPAGGFREIIFTGSATEANNLVLRGLTRTIRGLTPNGQRPRLIISAIEHESVLETARDLGKEDIEVIYLPVDREGFVDLKKLKESLNEQTILVSIMYANNEIGTIQPIAEISKIIQKFREERNLASKKSVSEPERVWSPAKPEERGREPSGRASGWASETPSFREARFREVYPLFHTDAVQAFQFLDCDVNKLGVDLMTLSAHKIYGPKGIGVLYVRNLQPTIHNLQPIVTGGGQEFGFRSGTENVPAIVGFAKAAELAISGKKQETRRVLELRDYFWHELKKICPKAELNACNMPYVAFHNLPNILNIYFSNRLAEDLLIKFDMAGIAVSSGSACSTRSSKPSHVLQALGFPPARTKNSIRFSFGRFTTKAEIIEVLKRIKKILK
jgi:cysteine desulfurase